MDPVLPFRRVIVTVALLVGMLSLPAGGAHADEVTAPPPAPVATSVTTTAPDRAYVDTEATLTAVLADATGVPASGVPVSVERLSPDGVWEAKAAYITDAAGGLVHPFRVERGATRFRVVFAGDAARQPVTSEVERVTGQRIKTVLTLAGPTEVKNANTVDLTLQWTAKDGRSVSGKATVFTQNTRKRWERVRVVRVRDGQASFTVAAGKGRVWRVRGTGGEWYRAATSNRHRVTLLPFGTPVRLPAGAPAPRVRLPAQPAASGVGLNAVVTPIPDDVWASMVGRSWHSGCPVGRDGLRLIRMNYWGYDGYRYRGELVVNAAIAGKTVSAFGGLYAHQFPIRSMYRVDRFGWSHRLGGADDYASMAAGNTSAFNCRDVVGRPGRTSPHASGRSVDINPWENPYASTGGWVPNSWWVGRSHPRVAWRSRNHPVVALLRKHGFRWTYGTRDAHHFDG
jgi:hypothetical protein